MAPPHTPLVAGVGKTQLVKGKLAGLPEDVMSLGISFNYFTDVTSFQKVGNEGLAMGGGEPLDELTGG